jgi:hypothetical protein
MKNKIHFEVGVLIGFFLLILLFRVFNMFYINPNGLGGVIQYLFYTFGSLGVIYFFYFLFKKNKGEKRVFQRCPKKIF